MKNKIIITIISSSLTLFFIYVGVSKYSDFSRFIYDMHNQPIPKQLSNSIIWLLPPLEILIAIFLLLDKTVLIGLYTSVFTMIVFTLYSAAVLAKYFENIPCSCGGIIRGLTWKQQLFLTSFICLISIIGIYNHKKITCNNRGNRKPEKE